MRKNSHFLFPFQVNLNAQSVIRRIMQYVCQKNERRHHLRYEVMLPIELVASNVLSLRVKAIDISMTGIHFLCDRWDYQQLLPAGSGTVSPGKPQQVTIRFKLPKNPKKLNIFSEMIQAVRLSEDTYRVGLRFSSFWGDSKTRLEEFIKSLQ